MPSTATATPSPAGRHPCGDRPGGQLPLLATLTLAMAILCIGAAVLTIAAHWIYTQVFP